MKIDKQGEIDSVVVVVCLPWCMRLCCTVEEQWIRRMTEQQSAPEQLAAGKSQGGAGATYKVRKSYQPGSPASKAARLSKTPPSYCVCCSRCCCLSLRTSRAAKESFLPSVKT